MLELEIPAKEMYNEDTNEFVYSKPATLRLEHSLVSISKWEAKWKKPFLLKGYEFPREEMVDYVRCMTISQNIDSMVYKLLTRKELEKVNAYIEDELTATKFSNLNSRPISVLNVPFVPTRNTVLIVVPSMVSFVFVPSESVP